MAEAIAKRDSLVSAKASGKSAWTDKLAQELSSIVKSIAEVEAIFAKEIGPSEEPKEAEYTPAKGTEALVHVRLAKGPRFDSNTGKEIGKSYVQMFTRAEWTITEPNLGRLGIRVLKVLHNPKK